MNEVRKKLVSVWMSFAKISKSQTSSLWISNTKSTISQKLKVVQKKTQEQKIRFRTFRIFWDIIFDHIWLVKTLRNCEHNQSQLKNKKCKNRKMYLSFVSSHCASFMKIWPPTSLLGTGPSDLVDGLFELSLLRGG